MIHGHGDDVYRFEEKIQANFSTNVWYGTDVKLLRQVLNENADAVLHYPEPDAASFRAIVAAEHRLAPESVLVGNGATELFYLIAHAFAGVHTVIPVPSFAEYEDASSLYDHHICFLSGEEVENIPVHTGLMFICNPNNPDGRIWEKEKIRFLLENYPDMTLVVDESFIHFAPLAQSAYPLIEKYPNLLVVRSMTKSFAIPGLRLGYLLGEARLIEFIACYKQPWSVNALAIEMGKYLLQHAGYFLPDAGKLKERQRAFAVELATIPGFYPLDSATSFFLVRTDYDSRKLKETLLKEGILIRDASNFRGLDAHYFRINTLSEDKNRLLIHALKKYAE